MASERGDAALQNRRPPSSSNCFGTSAPSRRPAPPAAMMAVTCMDRPASCGQTMIIARATCRAARDGARRPRVRTTSRTRSANSDACVARHAGRSGSARERSASRRPGRPSAVPSSSRDRLPAMLTGTTGSLRVDRQQERAPLESPDRAVDAARAFGKHDQRMRCARPAAPSSSTMPAPGFCRSTSRWPVRCRCQPRNGNPAERLLRDDAQLQRQRREHDRDVVDALVIRGEHVAARRIEALEPATATRTPVVFRISHAHARAQRWPKSPRAIEERRQRATPCRARSCRR